MHDQLSRQEAIDITRSFNVRAPAGSGKTGLLTQRALALLAVVEHPEEVLCVTFTRKAANEMRTRLLTALQNVTSETPADLFSATTHVLARRVLQRSEEKNWQLTTFPNRLTIMTIDGFCAGLARQFPIVSGLGICPPISETPAEWLYQAAQQLLQHLDGNNASLSNALTQVLKLLHNNQRYFCQYMAKLLTTRDQWSSFLHAHLLPPENRQAAVLQLVNAHLARTATALKKLIDLTKLIPLLQFSTQQEENTIVSLDTDANNLVAWRKVHTLLLTGSNEWRKRVTIQEGFPPKTPQQQAMKALLDNLQALPIADSDEAKDLLTAVILLPDPKINNPLTDDLLIILPALAEELHAVFRAENIIDFTGVALAANQALGDADAPTDLLLKLDFRIKHILVDEFQDTSSVQVELLKRLTTGWEHGDGRTVFLVGDPMQSCYQFRGANLPLYLHTRQHGITSAANTLLPERLTLSSNFRSAPLLVNWANRTFGNAFPHTAEPDIGATPFEMAIAAQPDDASAAVHVIGIPQQKTKPITAVISPEARIIAAQVRELLAHHPQDNIGILARNRQHLKDILSELAANKISWQAAAVESLAHRTVVMDLLILTRALSNTLDRIAWLALLRTPWFGLDNTDLWVLGHVGKEWRLLEVMENPTYQNQLSAHGTAALARGLPVLQRALAARGSLPLATVVEATWIELGGAVELSNADEANTRTFFDLLTRCCQSGRLPSTDALEREVAMLYAAPDPHGNAQVQVMTMHKAKGLEFDSVILPSLHRYPRNASADLLRWESYQGTLLLDAQPADNTTPSLFNYLKYWANRKERWERARLLYIACTRARKRLYLYGEMRETEDGDWLVPDKRSLLSCVWQSVRKTVERVNDNSAPAVDNALPPKLQRLPSCWRLPPPPDSGVNNLPVSTADDKEQDHDAVALGVLVHQLLEQVVVHGWPEQLLTAALEDELIAFQVNPHNRTTLAQQAKQCLDNAQTDTRGQWLFSNPAVRRNTEVALSVVDNNGYRETIRLDLLIEEDDTYWIVDYKISLPQSGESVEDFYTRQINQYCSQLQRYAGAVIQLYPNKTVRAALYFPAMTPPGWVELMLI